MQQARLVQKLCLGLRHIGQLRQVAPAATSLRYATTISLTTTKPTASCVPYIQARANYGAKSAPTAPATQANIEKAWTQLESFYQQYDLLNADQCLYVVELMEKLEHIDDAQLNFLLNSCVPELLPTQTASQRLQLFQRLWALQRKHSSLSLDHYQAKLQMLRQNQLPLQDHRALLAEIAVYNTTADTTLYNALLDVACASGNMRQATELLMEMREHKFALTERNFLALLLGHARNGDIQGIDSVLVNMRAASIELTAATQALRIMGYLEKREPAKACELLQSYSGSFTPPHVLQMLSSALSVAVDADLLQKLLNELPKDYVSGVDVPVALRNLCIELIYTNRVQQMMEVIAALPVPQFNDNQSVDSFGVMLLHQLFQARVPLSQILQFARELSTSGHNSRALHLVVELALRRQPAAALDFLEALKATGEQLRPHYFWPLILQHRERDGESGVLHVLADMQRLEVPCDDDTLRLYVLPNIWQLTQQPLQALQHLDTCGVRPSQVLIHILTQQLQQHQINVALDLLQRYPTRLNLNKLLQPLCAVAVHARATKRYHQYAQLVQALQQHALQNKEDFIGNLLLHMCGPQTRLRQDFAALQRFVHEFGRLNLQISAAAADSLIGLTTQADQKEALIKLMEKMRNAKLSANTEVVASGSSGSGSGAFIKHPRDMSRDELECHLIELESKHLNTRGVLRRLLQLSVRDGHLERALELKNICEKQRVQTSAGMLAAIFDLHIKLNDMQSAQKTLQQLECTFPGFQIDEHKLIDYAALMVRGQQLEAAKKLLQQRAEHHKINGGDYVIKNVWQLLTNVAQFAANIPAEKTSTTATPPSRNLTYETFEFLRELGYCRAHNAVLGPIVREWLLRKDIDGAVTEFQQLASKYKHTPLQFELLSLLVRLSNGNAEDLAVFSSCTPTAAQQHLTTVTATVSRIHGPANMNSALLLALAESGTESQLRRLVINPEFRMNYELLLKNCEHLTQEGAIRTLLRLAHGVRGLQRSIDEQRIYDMLLAHFAKTNNYEGALNLFERLEADDELKISQEFLRNLVRLLQLNNVEIPSNIALRAQILG